VNIDNIWKEYQSALLGFLKSRVTNPEDAEDLLQEVLLKTYQNLDSLHTEKSIRSWIFQIARNTTIDYYRKKGRSPNFESVEDWPSEEKVNSEDDLSHCVEPFINALPEEASQLLREIELKGVSQKEFAETYNIPYSTLKSRVQKARQALRILFEDCCVLTRDKQGNIIGHNARSGRCDTC